MIDRKKDERIRTTEAVRPDDPRSGDRLRTNEADDLTTSDIARTGDDRRRPDAPRMRETDVRRAPGDEEAVRGRKDDAYRPPQDAGRAADADAGHPEPGSRVHEDGMDMLFTPQMLLEFRERWTRVQTAFVDEPRRAVQDADHLVAETVKHLAETFAGERSALERQWGRGDQVSTEDLRQILRRYRSFFDRLLSM
jgi:hypothetical protein